MHKSSFNEGWEVRPRWSLFAEKNAPPIEPVAVTLPHDALIGRERHADNTAANAYFPGGTFEYTKTFAVPEAWADRRAVLQFEGIYRSALVYVNEDLAGSQPSGYAELCVALDPYLRYGEDNTIRVQATAHADSRWYSGAGIYRPVHLLLGHPVHVAVDGVVITTPEVDDEGATVVVDTLVDNTSPHTRTVLVATRLIDGDGVEVAEQRVPLTVRPGASAVAHQRMHVADARRWGTEDPHLYSCRTHLIEGGVTGASDEVLDAQTTTFGIRTLALDSRHGLRINGQQVKLRGACVHHDNGPIGAATIGRAEHRRVRLLKDAGFNALRSAHNPMSRAMLEACDQLGVLVMDEAFDTWTVTKTDDDHANRFADRWSADLTSMVNKDRNHPSVVLYSIGNEIPETAGRLGATWARDLASTIRSLDGTRFTVNCVSPILALGRELFDAPDGAPHMTAAAATDGDADVDVPTGVGLNSLLALMKNLMEPMLAKPLVGERTAEAFAGVDVAGYNYMPNRYELDVERFPDRVIVGSETYPLDIDEYWRGVERFPQVIGDFTWTGWDYLGEVGIGRVEYVERGAEAQPVGIAGEYPWLVAGCGDIDITGHRRPASYYREIVFGGRSDPYLAVQRPEHHDDEIGFFGPWSWTDSVSSWSWAGHEGDPVRVEVYSPSDEVELFVNGGSVGRKGTGPANRFKVEFETVYEPGTIEAVGYTAGVETGRTVLRSATGPVVLAATADRTALRADTTDLAYVAIELVDADGTIHTTADRAVAIAIDGPAVLQGFGTGQPAPTEPFDAATRTTYDGRALAVIRPTGPGAVTANITADGCDPVTVALLVEPAEGPA